MKNKRLTAILGITLLQFSPTLVSGRMQNYWDEPAPPWNASFSYTWDSKDESANEGSFTLREYDGHGYYKEVTVKENSDGTCEKTCKIGHGRDDEEKDDESKNDWGFSRSRDSTWTKKRSS